MNKKIIDNQKKVLITGGSGLVGRYLTSLLLQEGFEVAHLSRKMNQFGRVRVFRWDPEKDILDPVIFEGVSYIVHLAGANIGEQRWTQSRKTEIEKSRIDSAELIYNTISKNGFAIKAFISASAIGYYGSVTADNIFAEGDPPGDDFLGKICSRWEASADLFKDTDTRVVKIRTSVVMEKNDSALSKFLSAAKFGLFPRLGNGKQYLPWIHPEDLCNIYLKAIVDEKMNGPYNAAAPQHVTQSEFMNILAGVLHKARFSPTVPAMFLKIALGEMSVVALQGSRINSEKIINSGFTFKFDKLDTALRDVLNLNR